MLLEFEAPFLITFEVVVGVYANTQFPENFEELIGVQREKSSWDAQSARYSGVVVVLGCYRR